MLPHLRRSACTLITKGQNCYGRQDRAPQLLPGLLVLNEIVNGRSDSIKYEQPIWLFLGQFFLVEGGTNFLTAFVIKIKCNGMKGQLPLARLNCCPLFEIG